MWYNIVVEDFYQKIISRKEGYELAWKILYLLNYDVTHSRPRWDHEELLIKELQVVNSTWNYFARKNKIQQYYEKKQTLEDPELFKNIFGIELSPIWQEKFKLNYQNGTPTLWLTEKISKEIYTIMFPLVKQTGVEELWTSESVLAITEETFGYFFLHYSTKVYVFDDLRSGVTRWSFNRCVKKN